jgi:hypothetical protein
VKSRESDSGGRKKKKKKERRRRRRRHAATLHASRVQSAVTHKRRKQIHAFAEIHGKSMRRRSGTGATAAAAAAGNDKSSFDLQAATAAPAAAGFLSSSQTQLHIQDTEAANCYNELNRMSKYAHRERRQRSVTEIQSFDATKMDPVLRKCLFLTHKLMSARCAKGIFNKPVNYTEPFRPLYADGYLARIPFAPMDLSTVETRLKSTTYASDQEFSDEVEHIWQNAIAYNDSAHWVHRAALQCQAIFKKEYADILIYKEQQEHRKVARATAHTASYATKQDDTEEASSNIKGTHGDRGGNKYNASSKSKNASVRRRSLDNASDYHSSIVSPGSTPRKLARSCIASDDHDSDVNDGCGETSRSTISDSPHRNQASSTSSLSRAQLIERIQTLEATMAASASAASSTATRESVNDDEHDADFHMTRHTHPPKRQKKDYTSPVHRPSAMPLNALSKQTKQRAPVHERGSSSQALHNAVLHQSHAVYEKLKQDILALPPERIMSDIYPMLSENPAYQVCLTASGDDEIELDLDKLNTKGVLELQAYLLRALHPGPSLPSTNPVPALRYSSSSDSSSTDDDDDDDDAAQQAAGALQHA